MLDSQCHAPVCRSLEESGKSAVEAVGKTLSALAPTIVCLNEVDMRRQPSGLSRLAEVLRRS